MTGQAQHRYLKKMLKGKFSVTLREARESLLTQRMKITDKKLKGALNDSNSSSVYNGS